MNWNTYTGSQILLINHNFEVLFRKQSILKVTIQSHHALSLSLSKVICITVFWKNSEINCQHNNCIIDLRNIQKSIDIIAASSSSPISSIPLRCPPGVPWLSVTWDTCDLGVFWDTWDSCDLGVLCEDFCTDFGVLGTADPEEDKNNKSVM